MPEPDSYIADEIRLLATKGEKYGPFWFNRPLGFVEDSVIFRATPEISENRAVNFTEISDIRHPGGVLIYIGTQPRTYDISAKFISRTEAEADEAYIYTHLLKSWTMPRKNDGIGWDSGTGGYKNTPMVLRLWGYDSENLGQFRGVPVVITSLNLSFPPDINYIKNSGGVHIPIIQSVSITLKEARKYSELRGSDKNNGTGFDLEDYKNGELDQW
jgi:hypothetical protein